MTAKTRSLAVTCLALLLLTLGGCGERLRIDETVPPPFDWRQIRSIAVFEFDGREPFPDAGRFAADVVEARFVRQGPYRVLPRSEIVAALSTQGMTIQQARERLEPAEIARLLYVDAVVVGSFEQYDREDVPLWPDVEEMEDEEVARLPRDESGAILPVRWQVTASVAADIRLVNGNTRQQMWRDVLYGEDRALLTPMQYVSFSPRENYEPAVMAMLADTRELYPYTLNPPGLVTWSELRIEREAER